MDKLDVFADVYSKTMGEEAPPKVRLKEINDQLLTEVHSDRCRTVLDLCRSTGQHLMFEPDANSKNEKNSASYSGHYQHQYEILLQ